ncbi:13619_t:CDS:2, partial [Dentiscutata heterogama]
MYEIYQETFNRKTRKTKHLNKGQQQEHRSQQTVNRYYRRKLRKKTTCSNCGTDGHTVSMCPDVKLLDEKVTALDETGEIFERAEKDEHKSLTHYYQKSSETGNFDGTLQDQCYENESELARADEETYLKALRIFEPDDESGDEADDLKDEKKGEVNDGEHDDDTTTTKKDNEAYEIKHYYENGKRIEKDGDYATYLDCAGNLGYNGDDNEDSNKTDKDDDDNGELNDAEEKHGWYRNYAENDGRSPTPEKDLEITCEIWMRK